VRRLALASVPCLGLALALAAPARAELLLRDGDRVTFLGDSITAQHLYTRQIEVATRLRYPALDVSFTNAGIGGHTAHDGAERLASDVLAFRPTVVFVNFGMNDAFATAGTQAAAFERRMVALLDEVARHREIRLVVWLEPTPFDLDGLAAKSEKRPHAARLPGLAAFVRREGARRGVTVVPWHGVLTEALARFRAAGRGRKLIPDRVHPGPVGHAIMALEALRALGADLGETTLSASLDGGALRVEGPGLTPARVPWDGRAPVTIDLAGLRPPVPLGLELERGMPAPPELGRLGRLTVRLSGPLPAARYRVEVDGAALGRFTPRELAAGVDLMAGARPRVVPRRPAKTSDASCQERGGHPFVDDYYCLWDLCQAKDRTRILLRGDQLRLLPDYVPNYLERYAALLRDWLEAASRTIGTRRTAMWRAGHRLTLTAE
jgi:endoglucanase